MSARVCIVFLAFIALACGSSDNEQNQTESLDTMRRERPLLNADSARIISLPTPMQIPALLRTTNANYSRDLLFPILKNDKPFFKSTLLFGVYILDLAYTSAFSDRQAALDYFKKCRELSLDMGLGVKMDEQLVDRFERNQNHPDSLGRIILEMYASGHEYFRQNDKEGIGLLMVMGCLFEGLHLSFTQVRNHDLILFFHILSQQKQYTSNLIYALDGYEIPNEVRNEYQLLTNLGKALDNLHAPSAYQLKTGSASLSDVNTEKLDEIQSLIQEFRESVTI